MTPQELGRRRDERILALVAKFGCLSTEQVERAVFSGKAATRACQRRLAALTRRGYLQRERLWPGGQYVYAAGRVGLREHRMAVADVYLRALRERRQGERIEFDTEVALEGAERADALLRWHTADATWLAFIEVQRTGKARLGKYQRYLRSNLWRSQDWGAAGVYPRIVVVGQAGDAPSGLTVRQVQTSLRAAVMG